MKELEKINQENKIIKFSDSTIPEDPMLKNMKIEEFKRIVEKFEEMKKLMNNEVYSENAKNEIIINSENMESAKIIAREHADEFSDASVFVNKSLKIIIEEYQKGKITKISNIEKESSSAYFRGTFGVITKALENGVDWWIDPKKANDVFEKDFIRIPTGIKKLWEEEIPELYNYIKEKIEGKKYREIEFGKFKKIFTDEELIQNICTAKEIKEKTNVEPIKKERINSAMNRFFPMKFCLLLLAFEIYSKKESNETAIEKSSIDYSEFSKKLEWASLEFVNDKDSNKKNEPTRRENNKNTGFPAGEESSKRFADLYLGRHDMIKTGKFSGILYDLGLIEFSYIDTKYNTASTPESKIEIVLSNEGNTLVSLHSKMSSFADEKVFLNDSETQFLIEHIKEKFELEYSIIKKTLSVIKNWEPEYNNMNFENQIKNSKNSPKTEERKRNEELELELEKIINTWKQDHSDQSDDDKNISESKLRSVRISTIGRLVDLNLILWTTENNVNKYKVNLEKCKKYNVEF